MVVTACLHVEQVPQGYFRELGEILGGGQVEELDKVMGVSIDLMDETFLNGSVVLEEFVEGDGLKGVARSEYLWEVHVPLCNNS